VKARSLRDICLFVPDEGQLVHKQTFRAPEVKLAHVRKPRSEVCCLVDESGSLSRAITKPFRVGFLMTCRPERLQEDIRRLKRELPPRGRSGEYHAKEDDSQRRAMMRGLLCLNREPQMYIVEWRKDQFPDSAFVRGNLQVLADSNPLIASFAVTAADIATNFSAKGFSLVEIIVEATIPDLSSNHRAHRQALNQILPVMLEKQAKLGGAPDGTRTEIRVSTVRKKDCPILSFVDYWLWAYSRYQERQDRNVFPAELESRTHVRVMTQEEIGAPANISGKSAS
jgi:hypothetical protein